MPNGFYLTIGVNQVSSFYTADTLSGCVNDATDISQIAESQGFKKPRNFAGKPSATLVDDEATHDRVLSEIKAVAGQMSEGDVFVLHYSGHGLENNTVDESGDVDTCWATFDEPLIDNDLFSAWFLFPKLTRIFMISDSCHSGTMSRTPGKRNLGGEDNQRATIEAHPEVFKRLKKRAAEVRAATKGKTPDAGVLLLSGCRDEEESSDGDGNGLLTSKLKEVWADGAFTGDYRSFHAEVARRVAQTNPKQHPQLTVIGNPALKGVFPLQKPFQI
jgi:metacaspase-1